MALELFKPFVMKRLVDLNHAQNIKSAKRMVERSRPVVWDVLEEVISEHPVLLNRAPTLHRLGIQAFEPQLIEGKAIQIHPLVCTAFNADFDGDQMAVHLPLSAEAQAEARILMLSSNNILSPGQRSVRSRRRPRTWCWASTRLTDAARGPGRRAARVVLVAGRGASWPTTPARLSLQTDDHPAAARDRAAGRTWSVPEGWQPGEPLSLQTTLGRALFNEALPADYEFVNERHRQEAPRRAGQRPGRALLEDRTWPTTLDELKNLGFRWATRSGVTISFDDVVAPPKKAELLEEAEKRAAAVQDQYDDGLITDAERRQELIEIWTRTTDEVAEAMKEHFPATNPVFMMVNSGARGNWMQVRQIAGMRGLVANPKGEIIPRPIKSNYREGLSVLEYFIATHGARKGLADTALRTADSGYLTRRLVDVSQDVIIREEDCGTERGLPMPIGIRGEDGVVTADEQRRHLRGLADPVRGRRPSTARCSRQAGEELSITLVDRLCAAGVDEGAAALGADLRLARSSRAPRATAARWPPASWSTSARPSASSPPSRSASPARS